MSTNLMAEPVTVDGIPVIRDLDAALAALAHDTVIGFDLETTGFSPWRAQIATVQLYGETSGALALVQTPNGLPDALKAFFNKPGVLWVGHNIVKFDLLFLQVNGVDILTMETYDTLVGEGVVTNISRRDVAKDLGSSIKRQLGHAVKKEFEHTQSWLGPLSQEQIEYACSDVIALPGLMRAQQAKADETGQKEAMRLEMDIVPAVARMTYNGFPVHRETFRQWQAEQYKNREAAAAVLQAEFAKMPPRQLEKFFSLLSTKSAQDERAKGVFCFNPRSVPQLLAFLKAQGVKPPTARKQVKDKATGEMVYKEVESTDAKALGDLLLRGGRATELANLLLDYREPDQRIKNYPTGWLDEHVQFDGRVHPKFSQIGTDTGRFSSSEPNGQQFAKDMRYVFRAEPGYKIVDVDLEQAELLTLGEVAPDNLLVSAYAAGQDIHAANAAAMFGVPVDKVTKGQRRKAKATSFATAFGGTGTTIYVNTVKGLTKDRTDEAAQHIFSPQEAQELEEKFYNTFTGVRKYREDAKKKANRPGPVVLRLPFGLRRVLVGPEKRYTVIMNTLVQGRVAQGMKVAIALMKRAPALSDGSRLLEWVCGPVHDEFVAHCPEPRAAEVKAALETCMVKGLASVLRTPIRTDGKIADSW